MPMFTAYFDAAGNARDQSHVIVSGYIANYLQWQMFEHTWKNAHSQYGVELPFHMSEFIAASRNQNYEKQRNARADYVEIAKDKNRARAFFDKLCIAQISFVNCAVSAIVPMNIYEGVSSLLELREVIPPYALGAGICLTRIARWEKDFDVQIPVECIFEEGDFEQGKFTELMVADGAEVPIYKKKNDFAGLQGVDQYAWEQYFYLDKLERGTGLPARESFQWLLSAIPNMHARVTTAQLIALCTAKGIDPRTGVKHGKSK